MTQESTQGSGVRSQEFRSQETGIRRQKRLAKLDTLKGRIRFHEQMGNVGMTAILKARFDKLNRR